MRDFAVLGSGFVVLSFLAGCGSCSKDEPAEAAESAEEQSVAVEEVEEVQPEAPDGQRLAFVVEGGQLDGTRFDLQVADNVGYWLYDPKGRNTMVAARGNAQGFDAFLNAVVPLKEPGTYEFRPGTTAADTRVQIRFREVESTESFALIASEGSLTVEGPIDDYLVGTFSGKFIYSKKLGADLKEMSDDDREFVTVKDGRFAVTWKDRLGGKAERWDGPSAPAAQAEPATAETP
jgi:hypothetical protein